MGMWAWAYGLVAVWAFAVWVYGHGCMGWLLYGRLLYGCVGMGVWLVDVWVFADALASFVFLLKAPSADWLP